jgi:CTD small phosphatase-like protein 2
MQSYADLILNHMQAVTIRLYRQHSVKVGNELVKDLSRVGRDLSRVLLVDNLDKNFQFQKENGIHVRSWFGDPNDNVLKDLSQELERLAKEGPSDLRLSGHRRAFL